MTVEEESKAPSLRCKFEPFRVLLGSGDPSLYNGNAELPCCSPPFPPLDSEDKRTCRLTEYLHTGHLDVFSQGGSLM